MKGKTGYLRGFASFLEENAIYLSAHHTYLCKKESDNPFIAWQRHIKKIISRKQ